MSFTEKLGRAFIQGVNEFDDRGYFGWYREHYHLTSASTGFFQPYRSIADVHQQYKTVLVAPFIGLSGALIHTTAALRHLFLMALSIPCLSKDLFEEGAEQFVRHSTQVITVPLAAIFVTVGAMCAMLTRTLATAADYFSSEDSNDNPMSL